MPSRPPKSTRPPAAIVNPPSSTNTPIARQIANAVNDLLTPYASYDAAMLLRDGEMSDGEEAERLRAVGDDL